MVMIVVDVAADLRVSIVDRIKRLVEFGCKIT